MIKTIWINLTKYQGKFYENNMQSALLYQTIKNNMNHFTVPRKSTNKT